MWQLMGAKTQIMRADPPSFVAELEGSSRLAALEAFRLGHNLPDIWKDQVSLTFGNANVSSDMAGKTRDYVKLPSGFLEQ